MLDEVREAKGTNPKEKSLLDFLRGNFMERLTTIIDDVSLRNSIVDWLIKLEETEHSCQTLSDMSITCK
jgi:hypothetical protein